MSSGYHMRVLQRSRQLDLAAEAILVDPRRHVGRQHLDDDLAVERHFLGQEHTAHPPTAEFLLDGVGVADGGLDSVDEISQA